MRRERRYQVILALAILVWGFIALNVGKHYVGAFIDDGEYFVSGFSLAQGRGYRLPSRPSEPPATKFPVGLPILVAGALKLSPLPPNLANQWMSVRFVIVLSGAVFFIFSYLNLLQL